MTFAYLRLVSQKTKSRPSFGHWRAEGVLKQGAEWGAAVRDCVSPCYLLRRFPGVVGCLQSSLCPCLLPCFVFFLKCFFFPFSFLFCCCLFDSDVVSFLYELLEPQQLVAKCSIFLNNNIWFLFSNLITSKLAFGLEIIN